MTGVLGLGMAWPTSPCAARPSAAGTWVGFGVWMVIREWSSMVSPGCFSSLM